MISHEKLSPLLSFEDEGAGLDKVSSCPGGRMSPRVTSFAFKLGILAMTWSLSGAVTSNSIAGEENKSPPAKIEGAVKEIDLTTITLTAEAEKRLGVTLTAVDMRVVVQTRMYGGEIIIPPGRSVIISAPLAGRVLAPESNAEITPGHAVKKGDTIFRLWPVLSSGAEALAASDRFALMRAQLDLSLAAISAEGQVAQAQVRVDVAAVRLSRAQELQDKNAGSLRALDDAKAEIDDARAALSAAQKRLELMNSTTLVPEIESVPTLSLDVPFDGLLQHVFATANQVVTVGSPLFEVIETNPVWVRVPIFVGEIASLADAGEAQIGSLAAPPGSPTRTARRAVGPPSADVKAATVDLFFELSNADGDWQPGQRVGVTLQLGKAIARPVVPWSSILHDIQGGTWVYENTKPHVFVRRRVEVERVDGDLAILRRGVTSGVNIVTLGAAELYGTEFGVGK